MKRKMVPSGRITDGDHSSANGSLGAATAYFLGSILFFLSTISFAQVTREEICELYPSAFAPLDISMAMETFESSVEAFHAWGAQTTNGWPYEAVRSLRVAVSGAQTINPPRPAGALRAAHPAARSASI